MEEDSYNLQRFLDAQDAVYHQVCSDLSAGRKTSHWIWYIFPQLRDLGRSSMSEFYGIGSLAEAEAYLQHAVLGSRLTHCTELVNAVRFKSIENILGSIDALKFRSCMTLFTTVASDGVVFQKALDKYFNGVRDQTTVEICTKWSAGSV